MRSKLNISLKDYNNYGKIVIEMIPIEKIDNEQKFINYEEKNESFYHIYFINGEKEKKMMVYLDFLKIYLKKRIIYHKVIKLER